VLRAMAAPTIDHRGPEFGEFGLEILEAVKPVFGTTCPVVIYPALGTGAWEPALVNTPARLQSAVLRDRPQGPGSRRAVFSGL
jgi:aspartate aminotransferase-like enzyme